MMIRFARENDIDRIMNFIEIYWKKGHILANNKDFFKYEHLLEEGVTYVISENEGGEINAILGYIPYGKHDRDVMTVMWKANHTAESSLGLKLFKFLMDNGDIRVIASPGSNPKLKGLYGYLGYHFGKMTQWYRLQDKNKYSIAKITNPEIPDVKNAVTYMVISSWNDVEENFDFEHYGKNIKPYKEDWYIKKRYFEHPIYDYIVYGVKGYYNKVSLLMFFRVINVKGQKAIRLVDCIGDISVLSQVSNVIDDILIKYDAEYVDCYETGLPDSVMCMAGWKKTEGSGNIIPNYFEPFVQENIDIYYFSSDADVILFKADGDQDRPS